MTKKKIEVTLTPEELDALAVEKALKKKEAIAKAEAERVAKELKVKLKEEEKANKEVMKDKDAESATVISSTGLVVRTYTKEHNGKGEDGFVDKARGYATKIGGIVKLA